MPISLLAALDIATLFPRANPQAAPEAMGTFVAASVVKILVFFGVYMVTVALLTLLEPLLNPLWVFLVRGTVPSRGTLLGGSIVLVTVVAHTVARAREAAARPAR